MGMESSDATADGGRPETSAKTAARARLRSLVAQRRGVIFGGRSTDLPENTWRALRVCRQIEGKAPASSDDAALLPLLTPALLDDHDSALQLFRFSARAVRNRVPLFGATPLRLSDFPGLASTSVEPWDLDVDRLLAREELAALLSSVCEWRDADTGGGAQYLTPIEMMLSQALARAGITAQAQVRVGDYVADFRVGRLVVECDGVRYHTDSDADERRDHALERLGYKVVRFSGAEITRDADGCAEAVARALASRGNSYSVALPGDLQPSQRMAVEHGVGPALVVAPAGSGKTRVVEERVRRLVRDGVAPERICALSFTNAAVGEMRQRLSGECADVHLTTLHALASAICKETIGPRKLCQGTMPGGLTRARIVRDLLDPKERRGRAAVSLG